MEASEIMRSVNRLSLPQQMLIAERIIHSIRKKEQPSLEVAAERLCADYMNDENLTVFTQLDCEDFYETGGDIRAGWAEEARRMHECGDDQLLIDDVFADEVFE